MKLIGSTLDRAAILTARASCAILRMSRPNWADAMLAEFEACRSTTERLAWACGCTRTCIAVRIGELSMAYVAALFLSSAIIANIEWRTDEDIVTMTAMFVVTIGLGWFRPKLFLLSGLLVGLTVPAVNLVTLLTGIRPAYETATQVSVHGIGYVISLVVLVIPATLGTSFGRMMTAKTQRGPA